MSLGDSLPQSLTPLIVVIKVEDVVVVVITLKKNFAPKLARNLNKLLWPKSPLHHELHKFWEANQHASPKYFNSFITSLIFPLTQDPIGLKWKIVHKPYLVLNVNLI